MTHCRCDWPYLYIGVSVHTYRSGQWKCVKENTPYLTADRTQDTDRTPIHTLCIGASWPSSFPVQVILKELPTHWKLSTYSGLAEDLLARKTSDFKARALWSLVVPVTPALVPFPPKLFCFLPNNACEEV